MPKLNDKKRIVIITQGDKPVVYTDGTGVIREIPVQSIAADKIIDTVIDKLYNYMILF